MRRRIWAAAVLGAIVLTPMAGRAGAQYSVIMAGSRCASAISTTSTSFSSAWVCTSTHVAGQTIDASFDPQRTQRAFGCISIADYEANAVQRACGPVSDGALTLDPALQQAKIDFFLVRGDTVLAARVVLDGAGPYLVDHVIGELGNGASEPQHDVRAYGVARMYRSANLTGFIVGRGIGSSVSGDRGMISTGVAGFATVAAETL